MIAFWLENTAAIFGFIAVVLTITRHPWCWPIGLVQVALYIAVFAQAKLYSDMILHIIYVGLQIYGWMSWLRSPKVDEQGTEKIRIERLSWTGHIIAGTSAAAISLAVGLMMARFTDAASPMIDATVMGLSLTAQVLSTRRYIENWPYWIVIDVLCIGLFWSRGLIATSVLYAVFLILSIVGYIVWQAALNKQRASDAAMTSGATS